MPAKTALAELVSESSLKTLAGESYFERGLAYFRDGAVDLLHADDREITGNVLGTESYGVRLWLKRGLLNWACTCPLGEQGELCKHLVATGLTWLAEQSRNPGAYESPELRTIRAFLDQIEPIVRMTNNQTYDHATDIVRRIRDLMTGTGKGADFSPYLDTLRTQYKAKRNFMQRLDSTLKKP